MPEHRGISERVTVEYDPLYLETHYVAQFEEEMSYRFHPLLRIHLAWTAMLAEQQIIPHESAVELCQALRALEKEKPQLLLPYVPAYGDVYVHMEKYLVGQIGEEHVGHLALARTRPEPIGRMVLRERMLKVIDASLTLRQNILDTAERHVETVMPGYTHHQPAQPTTLGHYLMAIYEPVAEDTASMEHAFDVVNRCSLGCGALAGTAFPIDRERVAGLLGFDGVYENTYACVSSTDYLLKSANSFVSTLVTLSRLAQDFNEWCSQDIRMMLTAPQFSGVSSLMPQKYNPTVLEILRFHSSHGVELAHSALKVPMKSNYADVREVDRTWMPTFAALDNAADTMRLFGGVIESMTIYQNKMLELTRNNFSTVSELADEIYRQTGLPYRTAHAIVVRVVNQALDQGLAPLDITSDMLTAAAEKVIGQPLRISQEDISRALDPVAFVESHDVLGGPAPKEVRRMIDVRRERLAEAQKRQAARKARLEQGNKLLDEAVHKIIAST